MFHKKKTRISVLIALVFPISLLNVNVASANFTTSLSVNGVTVTTANSSSTPANVTVPADNSIDAADAVKVALSGLTTGTNISVITNNALAVGALTTNLLPVRAASGVSSLNINVGTGTTAEFYVYTLSTALSSFIVSSSGVSNTYYLKGSAGPAYNIEGALPANGNISSFNKVSLKITDVFGNPVTGTSPTVSAIGLTTTSASASDALGVSEFTVTYPATSGRAALQVAINATSVAGLATAKSSISTFIDVISLEAQLALERAEWVKEKAALQSQLTQAQATAAEAEKSAQAMKALSDANALKVIQLTSNVTSLNSELNTVKGNLNKANESLLNLDKKYKALVKKYNALAKKFNRPTIKG